MKCLSHNNLQDEIFRDHPITFLWFVAPRFYPARSEPVKSATVCEMI